MLPDHPAQRFWRAHPFRMTAGMLVLGSGPLSLLNCLCASFADMPPPDHCVCAVATARLPWVIATSICIAVLFQIRSSRLGLGPGLAQAVLPA